MQYPRFLEKSDKGDFNSHPLNSHLNFERDIFFTDLQVKFPPANPQYQSNPHIPNKRERYRTRLIGEISNLRVTGREHLKRYILHKFRNNCKRNTIRGAFASVVKFLNFIQRHSNNDLETLSRSDIEAFVESEQDRGLTAASLRTRLNWLYAFIRFLVDEGVMSRELLKRKIHIKTPVRLPRSIEPDDVERILSVIDDVRAKAMILLLLRTGMRIGELLSTTMDDISLEEQLIKIYESEKTRTGRVVYFSNDAAEALYYWLLKRDHWKLHLFHGSSDKAISYSTAFLIFKKYVNKAGLAHKGYTPHWLRHSFATSLLNARIPIEVLRDLLGHKNLVQTRRYAALTDRTRKEEFFRAMAIIEGKKEK